MINELKAGDFAESRGRNALFGDLFVIAFDFLESNNQIGFDVPCLKDFPIGSFTDSFDFLIP